jgi:RNA polymerase sigma-B factor
MAMNITGMEPDDVPQKLDDDLELFALYRSSGDVRYRDEIFLRHLAVVESLSRNFARSGAAEKDDLVQVGYLGLLGAIERFDSGRGVKFSTYASHCVDGEIRHFIRDKTESIRRPRWMRKLSRQVAAFLESYLQKNSRLPTLKEISEALNISEDGVVTILKAKQPLSLEDERQIGGSAERVRSLRHVSFQLPIEDRIAISEAFDHLLALEQKVIYLFFVQDLTQKQIAGKLSLSPRKVSRLMQKGLDGLRGWLEKDEIADVKRK